MANGLAISVAMGATVMGLGSLAAASLGEAGLRTVGLAFLALGGATAATLQWRRERERLDQQAVAELEAARTRLGRGDHAGAAAAAALAAKSARTPRTRNAALVTLAWAALGQGYAERAKAALDEVVPSHAVDLYCLAAVESARGRLVQAIQALEIARTARTLTCDGAKLYVDSAHASMASSARSRPRCRRSTSSASKTARWWQRPPPTRGPTLPRPP